MHVFCLSASGQWTVAISGLYPGCLPRILLGVRTVRPSLLILVFVTLAMGLSAQVVNYWRFENSPGYLNDSVGSATLTNSGTSQATLPGTGRGSNFLGLPSSSAADFTEGNALNGTIAAITGNFTIEAFIHRDTNSGVYFDLIAATTNTALDSFADIGFNFLIRLDGAGGTSANELILDVGNGSSGQTMQSNFIIPTGKDYYVAVTFNLGGGQATFYVQNLTDGGSLLTSTASHSLSSIASRTGIYIGGYATYTAGHVYFDGLLDEVRLSNAVLTPGSLLIAAIPEPGTYALLAGCAGLLGACVRRRRATRPSPARP